MAAGTGAGHPPVVGGRGGFGTAALAVSVLALLTSWTVAGGVLLGAAAAVLGVLGRRRVRRGEASNGRSATAGLVLGVVAVLVGVAVLVAAVLFVRSGTGRSYVDCLRQADGSLDRAGACEDLLRG